MGRQHEQPTLFEALTAEGVTILSSLDIRHPEDEVFLAASLASELISRCKFLLDNHVMGGSIDDDAFTL